MKRRGNPPPGFTSYQYRTWGLPRRSTAGLDRAAKSGDSALGTFEAIPRSTSSARSGTLMHRGTGQGPAIPSSAGQVGVRGDPASSARIGASGGRILEASRTRRTGATRPKGTAGGTYFAYVWVCGGIRTSWTDYRSKGWKGLYGPLIGRGRPATRRWATFEAIPRSTSSARSGTLMRSGARSSGPSRPAPPANRGQLWGRSRRSGRRPQGGSVCGGIHVGVGAL